MGHGRAKGDPDAIHSFAAAGDRAEAAPWRCHRSLVADALSVRGIPAVEILSASSYRMHELTPFAQVEGTQITYPPEQPTLPL